METVDARQEMHSIHSTRIYRREHSAIRRATYSKEVGLEIGRYLRPGICSISMRTQVLFLAFTAYSGVDVDVCRDLKVSRSLRIIPAIVRRSVRLAASRWQPSMSLPE